MAVPCLRLSSWIRRALLVGAMIGVLACLPAQVPGVLASSSGANTWLCAQLDSAPACGATSIASMPSGTGAGAAVSAPCPLSQNPCIYVLGPGFTVQAYDIASNSWASSDDGGSCASVTLPCMPSNVSRFAAASDACPGSAHTCLYVVGGEVSGTNPTNLVQVFDTVTGEWSSSTTGPTCASGPVACMPTARYGLAADAAQCPLSNDRCVLAIGGVDASGQPSAVVEAYDPTTNTWQSSAAKHACSGPVACLPAPRSDMAVGEATCPSSQDWCVYTAGGLSSGHAVATVEAFDPTLNRWTSSNSGGSCASLVLACLPAPVSDASAGSAPCVGRPDSCLYLMGGIDTAGAVVPTNESYDPSANTWTSSDFGGSCLNSAAACEPTPRADAGATAASCPASSDNCLYVLGGSTGSGASALVEAYDTGPPAGPVIYVSPVGNDANPGTYDFPLRTLAAAQSAVRLISQDMTGNITVDLENGLYRLTQPLEMTPADSGTNGFDVVWTSAPGDQPIVAGSTRITGWSESDPKLHIWSATVPPGLNTAQLYVNGARAWETSANVPTALTKTGFGYRARSKVMATWRNPSNIEFVYTGGQGQWAEPRCPIASIKGKAIVMAQPCWNNSIHRSANFVTWGSDDALDVPTSVVNAFELLDQPGEFYLDRHSNRLYYIPRAGENMATADVEAPVLETLVEGDGTPSNPIHNIEFSHVQFSYATWLQPSSPTGYAEVQAGYTITGADGYRTEGLCSKAAGTTCPYGAWTREPGNVQFVNGHDLALVDDEFVHLGAAGLNLDDGSQANTVEGSVFTDISGDGLELGGVDKPQADASSQTINDTIADNHISGIGMEYHGSVGILVGYAADVVIAHNQIDHVPYTGISIGWGGWRDKIGQPPVVSYTHNNVISDNLIYDFLQVLGDGGGIYNVGLPGTSFATGEEVSGNLVYDPLAWGWDLKSDDGTAYTTYSGNVLYGSAYDWGGGEKDTINNNGHDFPQLVTGNYWEQGTVMQKRVGVVQIDNTIIAGPADAPSVIVDAAGLEPDYDSVLDWLPVGASPPSAPTRVTVLYAYEGHAYITWHSTTGFGSSPVSYYTVSACQVVHKADPDVCSTGPQRTVRISSDKLESSGFVLMAGLTSGKRYSFSVSAANAQGTSPPSPASSVVKVQWGGPSRSAPPQSLNLQSGPGNVRLAWYPPRNALSPVVFARRSGSRRASAVHHTLTWTPVLYYLVTCSNGKRYIFGGHNRVIVTNHGGKGIGVVGGLTPGTRYTFSISAVDPSGRSSSVSGKLTVS